MNELIKLMNENPELEVVPMLENNKTQLLECAFFKVISVEIASIGNLWGRTLVDDTDGQYKEITDQVDWKKVILLRIEVAE